jgi:hypothetical protein
MAIWIEFRCEGLIDPDAARNPYGQGAEFRCLSADNAGPMEMANDTLVSVRATVLSLAEEATHGGWKRLPDGWTCPRCIARRAASPTPSKENPNG